MSMKTAIFIILIIGIAGCIALTAPPKAVSGEIPIILSQTEKSVTGCEPTPPDYLGPFYKAGAPVRSSVGTGYEISGVVRSSANCAALADTKIELWLTGPGGNYDDEHRATVYSDGAGEFRFESNFPPGYSGRPPHIHIRISANGFRTLATQHYPAAGQAVGEFDIVLVPAK
jgi:protocatechuate 3,4-dioxygenase beta subunit